MPKRLPQAASDCLAERLRLAQQAFLVYLHQCRKLDSLSLN